MSSAGMKSSGMPNANVGHRGDQPMDVNVVPDQNLASMAASSFSVASGISSATIETSGFDSVKSDSGMEEDDDESPACDYGVATAKPQDEKEEDEEFLIYD